MDNKANISRENSLVITLSRAFFSILLVFLPFQTSKVFFTQNSFYFGFHAFYNTIFIYLTDLLIFGLILAWLWESWRISRENIISKIIHRISSDSIYLFTMSFWLILAISLIFSRETLLGFYGLAKITGYLLVFAYVRENVSREKMAFFWLILAAAGFQSLLAVFQYLTQSSVGFSLLGEEFLRPGVQGVAKFATSGIANPLLYEIWPSLSSISGTSVVMRGYGTFPHPNVLAGFLFGALMINLCLLYLARARVQRIVLAVLLALVSTGLAVTFSRLAWAVSFLAILVFLVAIVWKYRPNRFGFPADHFYFPGRISLIIVILLISLGLNLFLFGAQIKDRVTNQEIRNIETSENYLDRKAYSHTAWNMIKAKPVFGIGFRNFVVEMDSYRKGERHLPYQHQPVHNIYLLILAEAGILALMSFTLLAFNIVRRALVNKKSPAREMLLIVFFGFLALGFFDHYFISIQQGALMFWLAAGLLAHKED